MFDYWNTVKVNDLADVLIQELPKLTTPKKQKMVESKNDSETRKVIEEYLEEGYCLVNTIQLIGSVLLIFEK